jgi:hypothetical protein
MSTDQLACRECDGATDGFVCAECLGSGKAVCRMCGGPAYLRVDNEPAEGDYCDEDCWEAWRLENEREPAPWEYDAP